MSPGLFEQHIMVAAKNKQPLPGEKFMAKSHVNRPELTQQQVAELFELPFMTLLHQAHSVHSEHFDANAIQVSSLLSIKTGGCSEDCAYCPQSAHHDTGLENDPLMDSEAVLAAARTAREQGAGRFCMGAAWRSPRDDDMPMLLEMVKQVKALGLETCMTLGMLTDEQARQLADAGLDYYNHNLDTSPEFYSDIITTRTYEDRLETLDSVRQAGIHVCCGGIVGMGESRQDRVGLLYQLARLPVPPESVPINMLVQVDGTPLDELPRLDPFEFVRTIAVARILMPASHVRLSAGREEMSDELQALCFYAGANSIFYGEKLLTTPNATADHDAQLFARLDLYPEPAGETPEAASAIGIPLGQQARG
jgi:biotin synthase